MAKELNLSVLDGRLRPYQWPVRKTAGWLLDKFSLGEIKTLDKKLSRKDDLVLDVLLLPSRLMKKNVLSYRGVKGFPRPDLKDKQLLGEVHLNPTFIRRRGENLDHMLVHGFLHLLGYDHVKKNDRMIMERTEEDLLKQINDLNL